MKYLILILLLTFRLNSFAQYPFEKYPKPKYRVIPFKVVVDNGESYVLRSANYKGYHITIEQDTGRVKTLCLYYKQKLIKRIQPDLGYKKITLQSDIALYAADIDGNGLVDFKFKNYNNGSGLASVRMHKLFLFNKGKNKFSAVQYMDFFDNIERDLNGDGCFEIVTQHYLLQNNHSYWVFDMFNFRDGKFVNVSAENNCPILVQLLYRDNYKITRHFSRKQMRKFSFKKPELFEYFE
ncbi:hypothetical protein IM792_12100 [Mucilaginibacter sp. JRF]|uniref:hypothetical protein n=1 Tax=Mucilaginibacter sp. JRF TaxID=2780088 RepID=UPI00188174DF|nr:hypothetical protein [Mucilaginibacter sp. JRF]MBE9585193.1 hypothetical protein [Mucilaginibacter sp. JRF]